MINDKPSLDTLAHYGVKGMKWGVRRKQKKLNRMATKAERYQYVSDAKKAAAKTIDRSARKDQSHMVKHLTVSIRWRLILNNLLDMRSMVERELANT